MLRIQNSSLFTFKYRNFLHLFSQLLANHIVYYPTFFNLKCRLNFGPLTGLFFAIFLIIGGTFLVTYYMFSYGLTFLIDPALAYLLNWAFFKNNALVLFSFPFISSIQKTEKGIRVKNTEYIYAVNTNIPDLDKYYLFLFSSFCTFFYSSMVFSGIIKNFNLYIYFVNAFIVLGFFGPFIHFSFWQKKTIIPLIFINLKNLCQDKTLFFWQKINFLCLIFSIFLQNYIIYCRFGNTLVFFIVVLDITHMLLFFSGSASFFEYIPGVFHFITVLVCFSLSRVFIFLLPAFDKNRFFFYQYVLKDLILVWVANGRQIPDPIKKYVKSLATSIGITVGIGTAFNAVNAHRYNRSYGDYLDHCKQRNITPKPPEHPPSLFQKAADKVQDMYGKPPGKRV